MKHFCNYIYTPYSDTGQEQGRAVGMFSLYITTAPSTVIGRDIHKTSLLLEILFLDLV